MYIYIYIYISSCLRHIRPRAWDCWGSQQTKIDEQIDRYIYIYICTDRTDRIDSIGQKWDIDGRMEVATLIEELQDLLQDMSASNTDAHIQGSVVHGIGGAVSKQRSKPEERTPRKQQPHKPRNQQTQIDHMWPKTLSKIHQTRSNMVPKSVPEGVLGALGGGLGVLGAILAPRQPQEPT